MKDTIKLEISKETAEVVFDVLMEHQKDYSVEFPTERILKIRGLIDKLSKNLYK